HWRRIYPGLGLAVPEERVVSVNGQLRGSLYARPTYPEQNDDLRSMLPYYNSGVLLVPRGSDLRHLWEDHLARIRAMFTPGEDAYRTVSSGDQVALTTAIAALRSAGLPFAFLPDRFHAAQLHVYRRTLPLEDIALFHAFWLFKWTERVDANLPMEI